MILFERLPRFRWKRSEGQEIIPPGVQTQCPELATDFKLLAEELMPHFRELDANALQLQNEFRLEQVLLIFGGALATILGALHASLGAVWLGITESVLAAALSAVAMRAKTTRVQQDYFTDRLKAEKLRAEYFLFLGRAGTYAEDTERLRQLVRRVAEIKGGGEAK
jgi:hypothetical protein